MALVPKTWRLKTYTPATYTDLVVATGAPVILKSLVMANTSSTSLVSVRATDAAGVELAILVIGEVVSAGVSSTLDFGALVLNAGEKLQVSASVAGVNFTASGAQ